MYVLAVARRFFHVPYNLHNLHRVYFVAPAAIETTRSPSDLSGPAKSVLSRRSIVIIALNTLPQVTSTPLPFSVLYFCFFSFVVFDVIA